MFHWARVHRTHHKFTETDRDPTDINRGLFYAYIGWLFLTPTPKVKQEMDRIPLQDLFDDKILQFQYR
jgi:stearoyl-CoA desaturase (Delta-9 desaturase)